MLELYYALIDDEVVALTYAEDEERARDQIDLALAEEDVFSNDLQITRFTKNTGTIVLPITE